MNNYYENRLLPYDPKPAYNAVKTLSSLLSGYRFEQRLNVGLPDDYVLVFRKSEATVVVVWTIANGTHQVVLPINSGRFKRIGLTGVDLGVVAASAGGINVALSESPMYFSNDVAGAQRLLSADRGYKIESSRFDPASR